MEQPARACLGVVLSLCVGVAAQPASPSPVAAATRVLQGRVVDERGAPLADVDVSVGPRATLTTAAVLAAGATRTDVDGRFSVPWENGDASAGERVLLFAKKGRVAALVSPVTAALLSAVGGHGGDPDILDDIVLPPGVALRGRVFGVDGEPLAGAQVTATDACAAAPGYYALVGRGGFGYYSATLTGADGRFTLAAVFDTGLVLSVRADGYYTKTLRPVSRATPLSLDLLPSGFCVGRVVNADGQPKPAYVSIAYEGGADRTRVKTADDGGFRLSLACPGRYRVSATLVGIPVARGESGLLAAPVDDLVVRVAVPAAEGLIVRAVVADTEAPVREFRAGVLWTESAGPMGEGLADSVESRPNRDGVVVLAKPEPNQPDIGIVVVSAPGHARRVLTDARWNPEKPELRVEMAAESTIAGLVRGQDGKPIAGATVRAIRRDAMQNLWGGATPRAGHGIATSAADGAFRIGELAAGEYDLTATVPDRPEAKIQRIALRTGQSVAEVTVEVPAGSTLRGKLLGKLQTAIDAPVTVELVTKDANANGLVILQAGGRMTSGVTRVTTAKPDGTFQLHGLPAGAYDLRLSLRAHPRALESVRFPIATVTIADSDLERTFELPGKLGSELHGEVEFAGTTMPIEQLMVAAEPVDRPGLAGPHQIWSLPARAVLSPAGGFSLRVTPGDYHVAVIDLATGLDLNLGADDVTVGADAAECRVRLALGTVRATLRGRDGADVVVSRLELRSPPPAGSPFRTWLMNPDADFGVGVLVQPGQQVVEFLAPIGSVSMYARSNASMLMPRHAGAGPPAPLGTAEVSVKRDKVAEVEVEIRPPELPATGG